MSAAIETLRATVWVGLFALVPFLVPAYAVVRRLKWDVPSLLPVAFAWSSMLTVCVAYGGRAVGLGLASGTTVWWAIAAAINVASVVWLGRQRGPWLIAPGWWMLGLAAFASVMAAVQRSWFNFNSDPWYHLAGARFLAATDGLVVTDPLFGTGSTLADPTSGSLHTLLAMVSRASELDPLFLWRGSEVIGAAVVIVAFWALARRVTLVPGAAAIATAVYFAFGLFMDMRWSSYPSRISFGLALLAVAFVLEMFDDPRPAAGLGIAVATVATIGMHIGSGSLIVYLLGLCFVSALLWAALERRATGTWDLKGPVAGVLWGIGATGLASLPFLLPRLSVIGSGTMTTAGDSGTLVHAQAPGFLKMWGGLAVVHPDVYYTGGAVMLTMAAVVGGFMLYDSHLSRERVTFLAGMVTLAPIVFAYFPPLTGFLVHFSPYMTWRVVMVLGFAPYVSLAWALGRMPSPSLWRTARLLGAAVILGALMSGLPHVQNLLTEQPSGADRRGMPDISYREAQRRSFLNSIDLRALNEFKRMVDDTYPMVAGSEETLFPLAGAMPVRIVASYGSHSPMHVELDNGGERREDMTTLLSPEVAENTRRRTLAKWDVDYVVLWTSVDRDRVALESMRSQSGLLEEVVTGVDFHVFRVKLQD